MNWYSQIHHYSIPTRIVFGPGAVKLLGGYLSEHGLKRPLLVTDGWVAGMDFFRAIVKDLESKGLDISIFNQMKKNPVKSDVLAGDIEYRNSECDCVVGIGGGVPMDVARAIVLRVNHRRDLFDYDDLLDGWKLVTGEVPHFVTIPTTSGTGSEVGRSAIVSEDESRKKRILFHPKLLAKQVFADPELTYELPAHVTAATGMDALTHNMEAFLAKGFNPVADGIALEAIGMISRYLERAVCNPDPESRGGMMLASMMGAMAFQKGLGIVHSLAHPLSTLADVHHGLANAIMIPFGMNYNYPGSENRFERMAVSISSGTGKANLKLEGKDIPAYLTELNTKIRIPGKLSSIGITQGQIPALTELALADFCLPSNPRPVPAEAISELYTSAL